MTHTTVPPSLVVDGLTKSYAETRALRGVSLSVNSGEIVALLGNNGAGKSTLMSICAGLLRADSGSVEVLGETSVRKRRRDKKLGLAPQEEAIYPTLTVHRNLAYFGKLAGLRGEHLEDRILSVSGDLLLSDKLNRVAGQLSGGQRRRLHVGLALMHDPDVLLLDEPTVGVDIDSRAEMIDFVGLMARNGKAVLYSTHQLHEVEELGASVVVIHDGSILARGTVAELVDAHGELTAELRFDEQVDLSNLDLEIVSARTRPSGAFEVAVRLPVPDTPIAEIIALLSPGAAEAMTGAFLSPPSLEKAYLRLTRKEASDPKSLAARAGDQR